MGVTHMADENPDPTNDPLRLVLWSFLMQHLQPLFEAAREDTEEGRYESFAVFVVVNLWEKFLKDRWPDHMKGTADLIVVDLIERYFFTCTWKDACDLVEYVARILDSQDSQKFCYECNAVLEREQSGVRFVNRKLVPLAYPAKGTKST
jgi:hypothetical protein